MPLKKFTFRSERKKTPAQKREWRNGYEAGMSMGIAMGRKAVQEEIIKTLRLDERYQIMDSNN